MESISAWAHFLLEWQVYDLTKNKLFNTYLLICLSKFLETAYYVCEFKFYQTPISKSKSMAASVTVLWCCNILIFECSNLWQNALLSNSVGFK